MLVYYFISHIYKAFPPSRAGIKNWRNPVISTESLPHIYKKNTSIYKENLRRSGGGIRKWFSAPPGGSFPNIRETPYICEAKPHIRLIMYKTGIKIIFSI